jgi:hypothetical protein
MAVWLCKPYHIAIQLQQNFKGLINYTACYILVLCAVVKQLNKMAVARAVPTCQYCGKATAKARHKDESNVPLSMRIIGDTFLGWDYKECNCKGARKARKEHKKWKKEHGIDLNKIIEEAKSKQDGKQKQN